MQIGAKEVKGWKVALAALLLIILSSGTTYFYLTYLKKPGLETYNVNMKLGVQQSAKPAFNLALSTHFDAWGDWRDAVRNVLERPMIGMTDIIGIGAGRPEWVYFKWQGHEKDWANHQKGEVDDLLLKTTDTFHRTGFKVAAIIDLMRRII